MTTLGYLAILWSIVLLAVVLHFLRAEGKYRQAKRGLEDLFEETLEARREAARGTATEE